MSAGIGVIGIASPMIQEVFGGRLIGPAGRGAAGSRPRRTRPQLATIGAAFAALLSVFNIAGRICWASLSDYLGRKRTYMVFFALGAVLYALGAVGRPDRQRGPVRAALLHHPDDVRRRVRDHSGLPGGHLRDPVRRRDPRPAAHRLVGRRDSGPGARQLHPRVPDRTGRAGRRRPTTSPCTSLPACWWSGSSATWRSGPVQERTTCRTPSRSPRIRPPAPTRRPENGGTVMTEPTRPGQLGPCRPRLDCGRRAAALGVFVTLQKAALLFK